jgi:hypothetical protein
MATERIEDVSTEKLLKRKKFIVFLIGLFIGIIIVWLGLIAWDLIKKGSVELRTLSGMVAPLAIIWLPFFMLSRVNAELKRRGEK